MVKGDHPFDFDGLYAVENYRDHKKLLDVKGPAIILAGSGMCTGGRIKHHLAKHIGRSQDTVMFGSCGLISHLLVAVVFEIFILMPASSVNSQTSAG